PFNYELLHLSTKEDPDKFSCTQFVHSAYRHAGVDTDIRSSMDNSGLFAMPIHPTKFINDKFKVIFISKSIKKHVHGGFRLNSRLYRNKLLEYILNFS
ncbi:hypothetical protein HON22_00365, partial [Candidatus Peregrinibacteria bacterium]|nr:hypothetical protein [Candidatus Peregrinibacteria bacterium]